MNTQNTVAAGGSSSSLINDDSLRAERTYENAPTNRVKHVALSKRRELYKKQMGDVSQVVSSLTSSSSSSSKRGDERRGSSSSNSTSSDESSAATVPASSGKKGSSSRHEEIVDPLVKSWHGGFSLDDLPKLPSATITSIHEEDDVPATMSKRQGSAVSTATPKPYSYQPVRQQRRRPARRVSMESDSSISIGSLFNDEDGSTKKVVTPTTKDDFSRSDASLDSKKKSSRRDTHPSSPTTNKKSNRRRASDATAATAPLYDSDSSNRESSNLFNSDPTLLGPESSPTSVASPQVQVTKPKVRSRRATVDNSAVSAPKVTLRRKYQPRHRSMANGSVQGIVKPSRYTRCGSETGSVTSVTSSRSVPTSFASLSKKEETRNAAQEQPRPRRRMFKRRASLPDKISRPQLSGSFTQLKPREITKLKNLSIDLEQVDQEGGSNCSPNVIPSSDDSSSSGDTTLLSDTEEYNNEEGESKIKRITSTSSMSSCAAAVDTSNDSWIPHGVDFSASMEVYVFEKYQHKI